jgi:hypothetical protein
MQVLLYTIQSFSRRRTYAAVRDRGLFESASLVVLAAVRQLVLWMGGLSVVYYGGAAFPCRPYSEVLLVTRVKDRHSRFSIGISRGFEYVVRRTAPLLTHLHSARRLLRYWLARDFADRAKPAAPKSFQSSDIPPCVGLLARPCQLTGHDGKPAFALASIISGKASVVRHGSVSRLLPGSCCPNDPSRILAVRDDRRLGSSTVPDAPTRCQVVVAQCSPSDSGVAMTISGRRECLAEKSTSVRPFDNPRFIRALPCWRVMPEAIRQSM